MIREECLPSRRNVLAGVAVTAVSLPVLNAAFELPAQAAGGADAPAATPGWTPTVKANDLVDGAYRTGFEGLKFVLARDGAHVYALSTRCTHKGCTVKVDATHNVNLICPCHRAKYDLSGGVVHGPAQVSLSRFPIRLSAKGVVEVDTSRKVTADDKDSVLTLPDAAPAK